MRGVRGVSRVREWVRGQWVRADDRSIINSGVQDYQTGRMQATMLVI